MTYKTMIQLWTDAALTEQQFKSLYDDVHSCSDEVLFTQFAREHVAETNIYVGEGGEHIAFHLPVATVVSFRLGYFGEDDITGETFVVNVYADSDFEVLLYSFEHYRENEPGDDWSDCGNVEDEVIELAKAFANENFATSWIALSVNNERLGEFGNAHTHRHGFPI